MVIEKGAKMSEEDKKKIMALKSKGATRSQLAKMRMSVLRGTPFAKAKKMAMATPTATADKPVKAPKAPKAPKVPKTKKMTEAVEGVMVAED